MKNTFLILLALSFGLATSAISEEPPVVVTELSRRPHPEQADKEIVVQRIVLQPGAAAPAHVHPGMVTGYVESGRMEFQIRGEALQTLKAGDTFFEPPGSHHLVARNLDQKEKVVVIAFVINPKGAPLSTLLDGHAAPHP